MFNIKLKVMMSVLLILFITACGGSGGGEQTATPVAKPKPTPKPVPVAESADETESDVAKLEALGAVQAMNNLKVQADFTFTSKQQVKVSLDLTELLALYDQTGQRAYVSVYHDYTKLPTGDYYPNSSSRILSGEIKDGQFQHYFIHLNNQADYLVEIWFYNGAKPVQKELTVAANNIYW
ncbi:MAG: hypothetical protein GY951_17580 [Psychromonas sp.]|nr:hypothetical protein [Alteromonadales bacterium]MCP5079849.1 hypothetical protein [Psychromonas sp.]